MAEWPMAPVLKTGGSKGSVGSNPTPRVSRTGVMATSWTHSPWLRGSNPGSAIEDANSNNTAIVIMRLVCFS